MIYCSFYHRNCDAEHLLECEAWCDDSDLQPNPNSFHGRNKFGCCYLCGVKCKKSIIIEKEGDFIPIIKEALLRKELNERDK